SSSAKFRPVVTRVHHGVFSGFRAGGQQVSGTFSSLPAKVRLEAVQLLLLAMSPMLHIVDEEGRQSVGTVGPLHPQVVRHGNKEAVLHTEHALLRAVVHMALEHRGHDCGRDLQDQHQADQTGVLRNLGWWGRAAAQKSKELSGSKSAGRATQLTIISRHLDSFIAPQQPQKPTSRMPRPKLAMPNMKKATLKMKRIILAREVLQPMLTVVLAIRLAKSVGFEWLSAGSSSRPFGIETAARRHRRLAVSMGKPDRADHEVWQHPGGRRGRTPAGLTGSQSTRSPRDSPLSKSNGCGCGSSSSGCTSEGLHHQRGGAPEAVHVQRDTFLRKFIGYLRDDFPRSSTTCNNGNPLDKDTAAPDPAQASSRTTRSRATDRLADTLMEQLAGSGHRRRGGVNAAESYISQDSFVQYCLRPHPQEPPRGLLAFNVIPRHAAGDASGRSAGGSGGRCRGVYTVPTDAQAGGGGAAGEPAGLPLLGNKLGFYESDMNQIENLYRGDRFPAAVPHADRMARKREGQGAYVITLQKAPPTAAVAGAPLLQRATDVGRRRTNAAAGGLRTVSSTARRIHQSGPARARLSGATNRRAGPGRLGRRCWSARGSAEPRCAPSSSVARPGVL
uniref:RING-type E3 ubiquitin transferase n=1 Tax=Macrostomum lignano TaxID=282301 RepID=A0A1I8FA55_9PLAT